MTADVRRGEASSRRDFLRKGTAAAITLPTALSVIGACGESKASAPPKADTPPAPAATPTARQRADTMDAMHEKGVKAFPARTEGKGNQLFAPRLEKGVKVYDLTAL
jgi:manganese oxidase